MIIYEMRQSAYDKAFDLIDEAHEGQKKVKHALEELYDCLMDCYESEIEEPIEDNEKAGDKNYAKFGKVEIDKIEYRDAMHNMRNGASMRNMRNNMRMRGDREGRYSY